MTDNLWQAFQWATCRARDVIFMYMYAHVIYRTHPIEYYY